MQTQFLDFEKPIIELQTKIEALRDTKVHGDFDIEAEITRLVQKQEALTASIFKQLNTWQIVQLARHPERPRFLDYLAGLITEFDELAGDRHFSDDKSIIGGIGYIEREAVMVIGHQKGKTTEEKIHHNFGMPKPEGYRKALRLMRLAEKFNLPIITFIDTPGAYPGIEAEARNQSEAIAKNLQVLSELKTPIISLVIGEGGSGGALAIGVSDVTLMLQYSIYSVISPEGCASILWRDAVKAPEAAEAMQLTAERLLTLKLIDEVLTEPVGGAHRNLEAITNTVRQSLIHHLRILKGRSMDELLADRYQRLLDVGH